jgi:hypothetical protein
LIEKRFASNGDDHFRRAGNLKPQKLQNTVLDVMSRISTLVKQAKALGMQHLAITDHGNMYGGYGILSDLY